MLTVDGLTKRYGALTLEPRKVKFIDRIVADSRDVALNHTAGLSLPQQVMMSLFSLSEMMDSEKHYQKACKEIVNRRIHTLIEAMGLEVPPNANFDAYYALIDFEFWARKNVGDEAVDYLKKNIHPLDLAFRDDAGRQVKLGDYFGARPAVLVLAYYRCPMICDMVMQAAESGLKPLSLQPGKDFDVIVASIDPADTPERAAMKKEIDALSLRL